MKILAGDLPAREGYAVGRDSINWVATFYRLDGASVDLIAGADKTDPTRIAHTTDGALAGLMLAGPLGGLIGGAVGFAGAKGTQAGMMFSLTLADGRQATCHGDLKEYAKIMEAIRRADASVKGKKAAAQRERATAKQEEANARAAAKQAAKAKPRDLRFAEK